MDAASERATASALAPSSGIELALADANDVPSLVALTDRVAVVQEMVRRLDAALEEQQRLAEFRIRIARKLGLLLLQTVRRGGHGSNGHRVTSIRGGSDSPLPSGISRKQSSRYQQLARVPDDLVIGYFSAARLEGAEISSRGLLRFASSASTPRRDKRPSSPGVLPHERLTSASVRTLAPLWLAASRVFAPLACVGLPEHGERLFPHALHHKDLLACDINGDTLVNAPESFSNAEALLISKGAAGSDRNLVLLAPAFTSEPWFSRLCQQDASICFVPASAREQPIGVFHIGPRYHAFLLVFSELGVVVRTQRP